MFVPEDDDRLSYTTRRLVSHSELDAILDHNIANLDGWRIRYPNHGSWIREVIKGIKRDDYSRLAFGVFIKGGENAGKLVCSAIVKKDHFGPYLEIKNLILLNTPEGLSKEDVRQHKQECYKRIIQHIQRFAESRGYNKLLAELFNRNNDERELIQAFLRCGFDVSGSRSRRYKETDEFIILSFDVDPVYGLDPYDFWSATKWLVKRHLPEFEILDAEKTGKSLEVEICVNGERTFTKKCIELLSHRRGPQSLNKFSSSCYILVIESYLASNHGIAAEDALEPRFKFDTHGPVYVFDFSLKPRSGGTLWARDLFPKIQQNEKDSAYFDRDELNELLYGPLPPSRGGERIRSSVRVTADLPLEAVGGLLTLTDPKRLDGENIKANSANGFESVYIKLGPKGKTAVEGQILAFYFPSEESASDASIWGYAEIKEVQYFNIDAARASLSRQQSDAEILFAHIEHLQELAQDPGSPVAPLWKPEQFEKHNNFNATNEVVLFYLTCFVDLRDRPLRLETVVNGEPEQSRFRRKSIAKEIDAYISVTEAQIIRDHAGDPPTHKGFVLPAPPYRVQCFWSSPERMGRIFYDGGSIQEALSARGEYEVSPPAVNVNYPELKRVIRESKPHMIHFCGHAESDGLVFAGSMPWILTEDMMKLALAENPAHAFLIVLNCCHSDRLAAAVSTDAFAIGFVGVLEDDHARHFPRYYLGELVKGFNATTLRGQLVDIVRGFAQETRTSPTLWFKGERLR